MTQPRRQTRNPKYNNEPVLYIYNEQSTLPSLAVFLPPSSQQHNMDRRTKSRVSSVLRSAQSVSPSLLRVSSLDCRRPSQSSPSFADGLAATGGSGGNGGRRGPTRRQRRDVVVGGGGG